VADDENRRGWDLVPVAVLAAAVILGLLVWWLYPKAQSYIARQDCIATGRTNC
jgi:hypothetical protein